MLQKLHVANQQNGFIPSLTYEDGEIYVKKKQLGGLNESWQKKKYIIDLEKKVFVIKRSNEKKKAKIYYLQKYQVKYLGYQGKRVDKYQIDIQPLEQDQKKISISLPDEKFAEKLFNTLTACCRKEEQRQQIAETKPIQKKEQKYFDDIKIQHEEQKEEIKPVKVEQKIQQVDKINSERRNLSSSDDHLNLQQEELHHHNQFEDKPKIKDLQMHEQKSNNSEERYNAQIDIVQSEQGIEKRQANLIQLFQSIIDEEDLNKNYLQVQNTEFFHLFQKKQQFYMKIEIPSTFGFQINQIYNLINRIEYHKDWNPQITKVNQKIENLYQSEIQEVREFKPYFLFPRVYYYQRQSFYFNNRIFIVDKYFDSHLDSDEVKGKINNGVWSITKNENKIIITFNTDQNVGGLEILKEEQFLIQNFLKETSNLISYLQNKKEFILNNPELNKPVFQKEMQPPINKQVQQDEEDEFYDCEDKNDNLQEESKEIQQETQKVRQDDDLKHQYKSYIEEDIQKWVERKMREFQSNEHFKIPLDHHHLMVPQESNEKIYVKEIDGGNYLYRKDWSRDEKNGGLRLVGQARIDAQKQVIRFLLRRIGSTLLTGKSLTNLSMPVHIFESRSTLERMSNSMTFAPTYLEKAAKLEPNDFLGRLKYAFLFQLGFLITFLSMEKPFNPILGETYQGWIDKCPIFAEQVSHHPPVSCLQLFGRGYRIDARIEMSGNIHSNSITGKNIGYIKIMFTNQTIYCMLAPGVMHGTMFGDRIFLFAGKNITIDPEHKLYAEVCFNPDKKYCQNFKKKQSNQSDYVLGAFYEITDHAVERYNRETFRKYQGLDFKSEIKTAYQVIEGNWTKSITLDQTQVFNVFEDFPHKLEHNQHPLASDSNYRLDLLWWKLKNFDMSQSEKEKLENFQRVDVKLRKTYKKN